MVFRKLSISLCGLDSIFRAVIKRTHVVVSLESRNDNMSEWERV